MWGDKTATQVITAYEAAGAPLVAVYKLNSNVVADVRYTLTARSERLQYSVNGGNQAIHKAYAGQCGYYELRYRECRRFYRLADCFTFCSEAHWDYTANPDVSRCSG